MTDTLEPILGRGATTLNISNSEIQTFKDCRRKWYLNSYLGLRPKNEKLVGPLPLGTRIHDSLEAYYALGSDPVNVYNDLAAMDRQLFLDTEEFVDETSTAKFDSESELGRRIVEGYVEWIAEENRDADFEFVSAEKTVTVPVEIDEYTINLIGKVDLKLRNKIDDTILITDHKSVAPSNWANYWKYSGMSEQLMMYISLSKILGESVDGGMYNLLKKVKRSGTAKPPFYERIVVRFNPTQLDSFWERTMSTLTDMVSVRRALDAGESHLFAAYPRPSNECSWKCDFFSMCTMMDDGSSYERFLADNYRKVDPNARYGDLGSIQGA